MKNTVLVSVVPGGCWPPLFLCGTGPPTPAAWKKQRLVQNPEPKSIPKINIWTIYIRCSPHLWSISCFMSMPCLSSSSLWAKAQSTGSTGVSAQGVRSLSARAWTGWLKRNTWLFPRMIRFPVMTNHWCVILTLFNHFIYKDFLNVSPFHKISHCAIWLI